MSALPRCGCSIVKTRIILHNWGDTPSAYFSTLAFYCSSPASRRFPLALPSLPLRSLTVYRHPLPRKICPQALLSWDIIFCRTGQIPHAGSELHDKKEGGCGGCRECNGVYTQSQCLPGTRTAEAWNMAASRTVGPYCGHLEQGHDYKDGTRLWDIPAVHREHRYQGSRGTCVPSADVYLVQSVNVGTQDCNVLDSLPLCI
ncbi:hypothetical protein GGX14DRAFT_402790 [Mycena pura]|uniref:Uncharacterized protein n=1 Tax=Mycena pura TaxID=153505 RepID=A0AAD6V1F0_9AGAR|nr:hypothetical protein GGX14DRAFT_402790 [Mycena pura]